MYDDDLQTETNEYLSELFVHILTAVCTILSVIGVFSGSAVCREIQLKKSTLYHRFLPFLTSQIYNLIWFYYGLLKLDWTIMVSHTIGCTMQTFYMIVYIQYANPVPLVHICAAWTILFLGWFHLNIIIGTRDKVISRLGFIGALSLALNYLASIIDFIALECNKRQYYNSKLYTANLLNEQVKNQNNLSNGTIKFQINSKIPVQKECARRSHSDSDDELRALNENDDHEIGAKSTLGPGPELLSDTNFGTKSPTNINRPIILNEYFLEQKQFDKDVNLKSQQIKSQQKSILTKNDKNLLSPNEQSHFLLPETNFSSIISMSKFVNFKILTKLTSNFSNRLKTFESYTFDDSIKNSNSWNLGNNSSNQSTNNTVSAGSSSKGIQCGASLKNQNSVVCEDDKIEEKILVSCIVNRNLELEY